MKSVATALFVFATGCAVESAPDPTSASAETSAPRLDVLLTDAPGDFENVWVNIASVEVESADAGWMTLTEAPQKFDLLTLQNDVTAALGGANLEPGSYGQLRLIVDEASVVVGGVESPLKIASGAETGIKINLDTTFEAGMTYNLVLDYDAAKSVKSTGHGYLMTPVIMVKELVATPTPTVDPEPTGSEEPIL